MKNYFFLLICMTNFNVISNAQNPDVLNNYASVYFHPLIYQKGKSDLYDIRKTVAEKLAACGVPIVLDEQRISGDDMKKPCTIVHCLIGQSSVSTTNAAEIKILFLDCKNDTLLICSAKAKAQPDFQKTKSAFIAATQQALSIFDDYRYHFSDQVLSGPASESEKTDVDSIVWNPGRKLSWSDFKGNASENHHADALTYSANESMFNAFSLGSRFNVESRITCYFIKANSWVKNGKESDYLLNHEQRHFDLSEVSAREFRMKLKKANFTGENFNEEINKITRYINERYDKLQELYDSESDHSRNEGKQKEWDSRIDKMLKNFDEYK